MTSKTHTEIIAISSGKGGTGKTLLASCLGYALTYAGHKVLLVDADIATDGLSHFILGPEGIRQSTSFKSENTFRGIASNFIESDAVHFRTRQINRTAPNDHGVTYQTLISGGRDIYGDIEETEVYGAALLITRDKYGAFVKMLFEVLREQGEYDYVLVDTRGGFSFESTDVCALADSFIVVTEADFTSFYQDRNLVKRINASASRFNKKPLLRSMLVNRALGDEREFRNILEREFSPLTFSDTHPIPLDIEAMMAYKSQQIPYTTSPGAEFSVATLKAFSSILQIVTTEWDIEQINGWNELATKINNARKEAQQKQEQLTTDKLQESEKLRAELSEVKFVLEKTEQENSRTKQSTQSSRIFQWAAVGIALISILTGTFAYFSVSNQKARVEAVATTEAMFRATVEVAATAESAFRATTESNVIATAEAVQSVAATSQAEVFSLKATLTAESAHRANAEATIEALTPKQ